MLAWGKETGDDWDVQIAENTLVGCFAHLVNNSPLSDTLVIAQLGDFLHQDGFEAITPTHGHQLDSDTRFSKMADVAIDVLEYTVELGLKRFKQVILLIAEGNHDLVSSMWLRKMFKRRYANNPRLKVIDSELPYYALQHGETMLAWHHGHLLKTENLPLVFAAQYPEIWGSTKKRYCHSGHRHHVHDSTSNIG
jgi:hypothetical protein